MAYTLAIHVMVGNVGYGRGLGSAAEYARLSHLLFGVVLCGADVDLLRHML